jgi:hypothetical protein
VKPGAEPIALVAANIGKPKGTPAKGPGITTFGHEVDPGRGKLQLGLESLDFL